MEGVIMEQSKKSPLVLALVAAVGSPAVMAVEPASMDVGNLNLTPIVTLSTGYTDNLFDDNENEKGTWVTKVRPSFSLKGESEKLTVGVRGSIDQGIYHSSSNDNYTDKSAATFADVQFDSRKKLSLLAEYLKKHEARSDSGSGSSLTTDQATKPSRYTLKNLGATFSYGTSGSTGQIVLETRYQDKDYDNFLALNRSKNRVTIGANATFFYRVSPKTRFLVEGRYTDIDYDLSSSTLDSDSKQLFLGVEWEATAKTTGTAKVGYANKDFDSSSRDDFSGSNWEVGLNWELRSYSVFQLTSTHATEESGGSADYIDTTGISLAWLHEWSDRVATNMRYDFSNQDYVGSDNGREDDVNKVSFGVDYDLRRWLTIGVDVSHKDFNSNLSNTDYKSNDIFLTVQGSL